MRILAINFSSRKNGNCANCIELCLNELGNNGYETEKIDIIDFNISPCCNCDYLCFEKKCPKEDGINEIINKCKNADKIIFALPTFRGHLPALYFAFSERLQGIYMDNIDLDDILFKKVNLIIIGNLSSGGDMALHEALYEYANKPFCPETLLLSSREYDRKSIHGDLIDDNLVKQRLKKFTNDIFK